MVMSLWIPCNAGLASLAEQFLASEEQVYSKDLVTHCCKIFVSSKVG
jgi:hypothetical protein